MRRCATRGWPPAAVATETGFGPIEVLNERDLLRGLPSRPSVYKHHTEESVDLPRDFRVLARSDGCAVEAVAAPTRRWWARQFHPEEGDPDHPAGERVLRNLFALAELRGW